MGHGGRLAALTVIAFAGLGVGAASAGVSHYPTVFTKFQYELQSGKAKFRGRIDSGKGGCIPDRKVKLYRKQSGDQKKVGAERTDAKGKFVIDLGGGPPRDGKYHAEVTEAKLGGRGDQKTCLARSSPSVKLSG